MKTKNMRIMCQETVITAKPSTATLQEMKAGIELMAYKHGIETHRYILKPKGLQCWDSIGRVITAFPKGEKIELTYALFEGHQPIDQFTI